MLYDMLQNYNLETKHYVILAVLGVVEFVLFALMFYNCIIELRQKRRQRRYEYEKSKKPDEEIAAGKPTLMEIFSVDMTLNRDKDMLTNKIRIPCTHNSKGYFPNHHNNHNAHRPSRNSL